MYTFTCPLEGCNHFVMKSNKKVHEEAAKELIKIAKDHLKESHPEMHKSGEEVGQDIRSHMVKEA